MSTDLLYAQFEDTYIIGGPADEAASQLQLTEGGDLLIGGTFNGSFAPDVSMLPQFGLLDCFIGRLSPGRQWSWVYSFGSGLNDELQRVRMLADGGVLLAGTFWLELRYQDKVLRTNNGAKGIFVIALDGNGTWRWGRVIDGSGLKEVADVFVSPLGDIHITGHFSDTLRTESITLVAAGDQDAYLLQLDSQGGWEWGRQLGFRGQCQGRALAPHPDDGLYWIGVYDDTLHLADTTLLANTFDRDIFLTRIDDSGAISWARRAGGVFDDEPVAVEVTSDGDLLMTGYLVGVMSLSEAISVQSRNGDPDIFLARYEADGTPLWARAVGSEQADQPAALLYRNGQAVIGGFHFKEMTWDGLSADPGEGVGAFVASFDAADGRGQWLYGISSDGLAFVDALAENPSGGLLALGSFTGTIEVDGQQFRAPGHYDMLLSSITEQATGHSRIYPDNELRIFPNPANEVLYIQAEKVSMAGLYIYDSTGRLVQSYHRSALPVVLPVQNLSAGVYYVIVPPFAPRRIVIHR